jgi:hypothetical protein
MNIEGLSCISTSSQIGFRVLHFNKPVQMHTVRFRYN